MNIYVFDTHVKTSAGQYLHFDVFIGEKNKQSAQLFTRRFLKENFHIDEAELASYTCQFCHCAIANPEVKNHVKNQGYYVLPIEIN